MDILKELNHWRLRPIGFYRRTRDSLKKKRKLCAVDWVRWQFTHKEKIEYFKTLCKIYILYGIVLDFTAWVFLKIPFNGWYILGFSCIAYIIKVELPYVIRSSR